MSDVRPDLNTTLANVAVSFDQKARTQRERLRELERSMERQIASMVEPPPDAVRGVREQFGYEMAQARTAVERWEARAQSARSGLFLARQEDLHDPDYLREFSDVFTACQEQGRVTYRLDTEGESMEQQAAGHPTSIRS